jgi:hypothetical protein
MSGKEHDVIPQLARPDALTVIAGRDAEVLEAKLGAALRKADVSFATLHPSSLRAFEIKDAAMFAMMRSTAFIAVVPDAWSVEDTRQAFNVADIAIYAHDGWAFIVKGATAPALPIEIAKIGEAL